MFEQNELTSSIKLYTYREIILSDHKTRDVGHNMEWMAQMLPYYRLVVGF